MVESAMLQVLLIEDHAEIASMMVATLRMLGHETVWGQTVAEAVQRASDAAFDVILADYTLPDGTALDLVAQLKAANVTTPVVLLTAHEYDFLSPADQVGFASQLQKPVGMDELGAALLLAAGTGHSTPA